MSRLLTFPASRGRKWIVLAAWAAVLAVGFPFGAKFESAQSNDPASFLPGGAESLEAIELSERFRSGQQVPAVIVFRRTTGLTSADRRVVRRELGELREGLPSFAQDPTRPLYSRDGRAAIAVVAMEPGDDLVAADAAVTRIRADLAGAPAGLDVRVGGPAGLNADLGKVFDGINGTLLLATAALVFVLLILIYRSPVFWVVPLVALFAAELTTRALGYGLTQAGVTVNGQVGGILLVLVFGSGTDYALLLVSRYREELRRHADRHLAMRVALLRGGPAILASAGTVVAGLLCLALAEVNGTAGLGTVGALGVAVAALAMLTILPAVLVIAGRWVFWPFVPRVGEAAADASTRGVFRRVGERIARRPRRVWAGSTLVLAVCVGGLAWLSFGLTTANGFRGEAEAVDAQALIAQSFPAGSTAPTSVIVRDPAKLEAVRAAVAGTPGVSTMGDRVERGAPGARFDVTLTPPPYSEAAYDVVPRLRASIARAGGTGAALVGGPTAEEADLRAASARDTRLLPPIVLAVVLVILVLLLRSLVAPLVLVATVVLSFGAALGVSALVFDTAFGFPGVDPSFPLTAFIFLVALGVDYNIFLMARVREEALRHGTREGMLRGLAATGSVISSAGIVLAGTFAVLGVLPFVPLTEIGFAVAFGVLLDTLLVRSVLVPALVFDLDRRVWWPSRLAQTEPESATGRPPAATSRRAPALR